LFARGWREGQTK